METPVLCPAFDAVAASYDGTFTSSVIGRAQRAAVWKRLSQIFQEGDRVLEIGCGTGVDACFLAERGVEVLACDPSSQMIDVAASRIRQRGFDTRVRTRVLRAEDISSLRPDESFDGAFSNFGALNCVEDLKPLAQGLARLLKPGAEALLCWMGPYCLWETLFYLGRGNATKAFRRFHHGGAYARIGESAVRVHYPSAGIVARTFAPEFRLVSVQGIGVAVPPSYLEPWAQRHPRFLKFCEHFDSLVGSWPGVRSIGDHVLVRLQRKQDSGQR